MMGVYYVTNIEGVDKLPENIVKSANLWLEAIDEPKEGAEE